MQGSFAAPVGQYVWFNKTAALVLLTGAGLHAARQVFGRDWLLQNLLTPAFDMALAVPMTFAAVCLWAFRRRVRFSGRLHQVPYYVAAVYFTASLPLHIQKIFTGSLENLRLFPVWFSVVIIWVQLGFAPLLWRTTVGGQVLK